LAPLISFLARHRLLASRLFIIPIVYFAAPSARSLAFGLPFILLGIFFRTWAAGSILKDGPSLATSGPYTLCRHPLYLGTFLQGLGWCIASSSHLLVLIYLAFFFIFYIPTIIVEEFHLTTVFPESYPWFRKTVPALVPNPFRLSRSFGAWSWERFKANHELANYGINAFLTLWFIMVYFSRSRDLIAPP
jgi:protein-S-isoprenylcysteine O-methyltransferase Ste14